MLIGSSVKHAVLQSVYKDSRIYLQTPSCSLEPSNQIVFTSYTHSWGTKATSGLSASVYNGLGFFKEPNRTLVLIGWGEGPATCWWPTPRALFSRQLNAPLTMGQSALLCAVVAVEGGVLQGAAPGTSAGCHCPSILGVAPQWLSPIPFLLLYPSNKL